MAAEHSNRSEIPTSAQPEDSVESSTQQQENVHHEHGSHRQPWYAVLGEDWLATIAGLLLVVLLVFRVLHAIP